MMEQGLEQVMRLIGHRAVEWMRQSVMALPDPLPADDPATDALAKAAIIGPILGALTGRPSPVEVLARRRLCPDTVRCAALDHLSGRGSRARLILAARLVAPEDAACRLAQADLAHDAARPAALRLMLGASPPPDAEAMLLAPLPPVIDRACLSARLRLLLAWWRQAGGPPRLSSPGRHGDLLRALRGWAGLARQMGDTQLLAEAVCGLLLVDPHHDVADMLTRIMDLQGPDGAFPARLRRPETPTPLAEGIGPTLSTLLAFQLTRPGRRIAPAALPERAITGAMLELAAAMAQRIETEDLDPRARLLGQVLLMRATGRNHLADMGTDLVLPDRALVGRLASIVFGDPVGALALRRHLGWRQPARLVTPELAWLSGAPVRQTGRLPADDGAIWMRAVQQGDGPAFMALIAQARRHGALPDPCTHGLARRLAGTALAQGCRSDASFTQLAAALERVILLATVFDQPPAPAMVA